MAVGLTVGVAVGNRVGVAVEIGVGVLVFSRGVGDAVGVSGRGFMAVGVGCRTAVLGAAVGG